MDLSIDTEDVLQAEDAHVPMTAIPVVVEGPTRVQQLPTRSAGMRSYDLTTEPVRVLEGDPRRRQALLSASAAILVGPTQAAANAGAQLQSGNLPPLTTSDEVWARAVTGTATLGVINEQWAD